MKTSQIKIKINLFQNYKKTKTNDNGDSENATIAYTNK